mmetsp:Transcript_9524/g.6874  ORF Transcript_9524/g.6874 Transcript_9524/m.6874 type:complete len:88 (+) Transcript_9524:1214-1477(+)
MGSDFYSSLEANSKSHNVTIGVDPRGLDVDEWRTKTYANPLPIMYELVPIYELFKYQDMCTYVFPTKDCSSIYNNMLTAASTYCEHL